MGSFFCASLKVMALAWRFLKRTHGFLVAALIFTLLLGRQFDVDKLLSDQVFRGWRFWTLLLLAAYLSLKIGRFFLSPAKEGGKTERAKDLQIALLILASINVIIQLSGLLGPYLYPVNYLVPAVFTIYFGIATALALALVVPLVELVGVLVSGPGGIGVLIPPISHALTGVIFVMIVGSFLFRERRVRERALDKLHRLTSDAEALSSTEKGPALMREAAQQTDINHTRELDTELAELMDIARQGLKADACVTLFSDQYGVFLRVRAMSGNPAELDEDAVIPIEGSVPGLVLNQGDALLMKRIDKSRPLFEYRRTRTRIRSCIAQPLIFQSHPIGVLMADSKREDAFDAAAEDFLRKIAARVVKAYQAAQNVASIDRERAEFAAYYDVVNKFSQAVTLDEAMDITFDVGRAILPYDGALVSFSNADGQKGRIAGVDGFPDKWIGVDFSLKDSLAGHVTLTRKPLAYTTPPASGKPLYHPDCKFRGMKSFLILPLTVRDRVLGTIAFTWEKEDAFTPYDKKLMEVVAVHAATSLDAARMYGQMEQLATTDGLTGLPNHRMFQARLEEELARYKRLATPIGLILLDLDYFKNINDTYGHPVGDMVLKEISKLLASSLRRIDMAARYGGEEFALILPNTKTGGAWKFAERLRKQISGVRIRSAEGELKVTVSLGIAVFPTDAKTKESLIKAADKALYHSKQNGRDRSSWIGDLRAEKAS